MNIHHLNQAIEDCDNGILHFNLGSVRAFLFMNRWYPLRATINRAAELAQENRDLTTDRALVELVYLGLWTRIEDVTFQNQLPIQIDANEKFVEINKLAQVVLSLSN